MLCSPQEQYQEADIAITMVVDACDVVLKSEIAFIVFNMKFFLLC